MNRGGVLLIDKPLGITSSRVVAVVKKLFDGAKTGHAGTLDPAASGILPVLLGEATSYARFLPTQKKYEAKILFGINTNTADSEGQVNYRGAPPDDIKNAIEKILPSFIGDIEQTAPVYSALKYRGRPLYYYARRGIATPPKRRRVEVFDIQLQSIAEAQATVIITCGGGFYVRSFARDIGEQLACGAHLSALRRIGCIDFDIKDAITLDLLENMDSEQRHTRILPIEYALTRLPAHEVDIATARALGCGQGDAIDEARAKQARLMVSGRFAGVGWVCGCQMRGQKMLSWTRSI